MNSDFFLTKIRIPDIFCLLETLVESFRSQIDYQENVNAPKVKGYYWHFTPKLNFLQNKEVQSWLSMILNYFFSIIIGFSLEPSCHDPVCCFQFNVKSSTCCCIIRNPNHIHQTRYRFLLCLFLSIGKIKVKVYGTPSLSSPLWIFYVF